MSGLTDTHFFVSSAAYPRELPKDLAAQVDDAANDCEDKLTKLRLGMAKANENPDLTQRGRDDARLRLAKAVAEDARNGIRAGERLQERRATHERAMASAALAELHQSSKAVLRREIRDQFRPLTTAARLAGLMDAAHAGDSLTVSAVREAPGAFPIVPEKEIERAVAIAGEKLAPEAKKAADDVHWAGSMIAGNYRRLLREAESAARLPSGTFEEAAGDLEKIAGPPTT